MGNGYEVKVRGNGGEGIMRREVNGVGGGAESGKKAEGGREERKRGGE